MSFTIDTCRDWRLRLSVSLIAFTGWTITRNTVPSQRQTPITAIANRDRINSSGETTHRG